MKASKHTPPWVIELINQVCADYKRATPKKFMWIRKKRNGSSGCTMYDGSYMSVVAGTDEWEHRVVLLHELAHHLVSRTRSGRRQGHTIKFWRLVVELNKRYGDMTLAKRRELPEYYVHRDISRVKATQAFSEAF